MKQCIKIFSGCYVESDINCFLDQHPNYTINQVNFARGRNGTSDMVLVVFNVKEPSYAIAKGEVK